MKLKTYLKRHKYSVFRIRNEEEDKFYSGKILLNEINIRARDTVLVDIGRKVTKNLLNDGIVVLNIQDGILIVKGTWARATDIYLVVDSIDSF